MKKIFYYLDGTDCKLLGKLDISATIVFMTNSCQKKLGRINVILTNNENLHKINFDYLQHDAYTDIITFDYCKRRIVSGDLYISADMVEENAKKFGVSFQKEMERVIFHGVLHLLKYKDESENDKIIMRKFENRMLRHLGRIVLKRRKIVTVHV
ncbi:MAG: rRNA maturation RNase YbeY [Bacteroidales bacterium]|jgi:rRNA maturation RNase YbeY|nr:rRNA maturation RNase YbeY [Bacteroidales bacterium]